MSPDLYLSICLYYVAAHLTFSMRCQIYNKYKYISKYSPPLIIILFLYAMPDLPASEASEGVQSMRWQLLL